LSIRNARHERLLNLLPATLTLPAFFPLLLTFLPVATVIICYSLSASADQIPACIPLLEGCTTISSAGRYGISYFLFKAGMLPTAVLLVLFWPACRRWFLSLGGTDSFGLRAMVWLGVISAAFLVLYSVFLGSDGDIYRFLRRFGVTVHFSFSYLAQVLLLNRLWDARREPSFHLPQYISSGMLAVSVLMLLLGLISIPVGEIIADTDDRIINVIEWNFALLLFGWYLLIAMAWRYGATTAVTTLRDQDKQARD